MITMTSRRLVVMLALAATATACASTGGVRPAVPSAPTFTSPTMALVEGQPVTAPPDIEYGMNDGFHGGIPSPIIDVYCSWGGPLSVRSPVLSGDQAHDVVESERPCVTIRAHLLVEGNRLDIVDSVAAYAASEPLVTRIECGNELELKPLELPVAEAAAFVGECARRLRAAGFTGRIVTGAIYTIDVAQITRLKAYHAACPDCECGLHWYSGNPNDWKTQLDAVGCPRYDITEVGQASRTPAEDAGQDAYVREETAFFWQLGVALIEPYQRPSGPDPSDLANFGWQRVDGTWKLVTLFWAMLVQR